MCRVATQHDLAESFQLRSTTGWQTLHMILQSTGERNPKRPRHCYTDDGDDEVAALAEDNTGEPLAKRFAAVRLNEPWPFTPPGSRRPPESDERKEGSYGTGEERRLG